ncbi:MAG: DUF975 family protein [Ruminococcaceae bacterium]|jgi:uncharacterized membrane protein|nr:DUF975 family protein [Oscillospiraceae bacterium]
MWDRGAVKARGKLAFQANYWRCVLVALILFAIIGGGASSRRSSSHHNDHHSKDDVHIESVSDLREYIKQETGLSDIATNGIAAIVGAVVGVATLAAAAVKILVVNPLEVGCCQFFLRNSRSPAELHELGRAFKPGWANNVVTLLLRDIFVALWTILLVVPGIVKAYAYRMAPYILAENPQIGGTEALRLSEKMMKGHKWKAFTYDFSFFGWFLLSALTLGILAVFYVNPYKSASDAELYCAVSDLYYDSKAPAEKF